jgi:hypothetical protein
MSLGCPPSQRKQSRPIEGAHAPPLLDISAKAPVCQLADLRGDNEALLRIISVHRHSVFRLRLTGILAFGDL